MIRSVTITCLLMLLSAVVWPQNLSLEIEPATIPAGLETVEFFSPAVGRTMKFDIVLPADYHSSEQRYPVLYLLHGYMQNYTVWGRNLGAAFYARNLDDLILVLPDGGNTWFVNYAGSDDGQKNNWEDHLIVDVIGHVDENYRSIPRREGRAIAGLSMGGFAAFALALRHPGMFVSMASTSGALGHARNLAEALRQGNDTSPGQRSAAQQARIEEADRQISQVIDIPGFSTQLERTPPGQKFDTVAQAEAYDPYTIIYNVPKSQLPHIYLDAGTEDSLINEAREFMQILLINNVPFDYMQSQGRHTSEYWRRSVGHLMTIQFEVMQRALGNRP
ncbi:MAG: alpha/beta hydrolase-fold protein [Pseudohongiellaceae bacterium]